MTSAARPFRFGINFFTLGDADEWRSRVRLAESLGYDVVMVPDHLGLPSPFPALVAAAAATERVRLGPFVLNTAFNNPTLLAREVHTVDQLTGGRLDLGLGTGYTRSEFDDAGITYESPGRRIDHLRATVDRLDELAADESFLPRPTQQPIPLLLAGNGNRMLRMAARRADIVGFTAATTDAQGRMTLEPESYLDERVAFVADAAGERAEDVELNLLIHAVVVSDDPAERVASWIKRLGLSVTPEEFVELPTTLVGTAEAIADRLLALRERTGISYVTVLEPALEQFAEVINLLRSAP